MRHIEKGDPRDVAAYCAFLWHHNESTAAPRPAQTAESEAVAMDADELAELAQTAEDFEDNGETSTPYDVLMNWAARGLLDCTHFELTSAGKALIAAQPAGGGEQ
jgi:hypothetical protein